MRMRQLSLKLLGLSLFLTIPIMLLASTLLNPAGVVRGKSSAIPLSDEMTPEQELAQTLALDHPEVQAHTTGRRSEVFGVRKVLAGQYTDASNACATATCWQVEIYNFDENAAVTADFVESHIRIGVDSLKQLINKGETVRHLKF